MKLKNNEIYSYAIQTANFDLGNIKLPIKIGFFLQKNIKTLASAGEEIEKAKLSIAQQFGEYDSETNQFHVPPDRMPQAQAELFDLFNLEQDINIHVFKLNDFNDIELTYEQLSSIMFMIEE